jgi:hypothetical protein
MQPPILRPVILIVCALYPAFAAPEAKEAANVSLLPFLRGLPRNIVTFLGIASHPFQSSAGFYFITIIQTKKVDVKRKSPGAGTLHDKPIKS